MATSRRVFLKLAAALSAISAVTPGELEAAILPAHGSGSIAALLRDPASARRIGEAFLRQHGESALDQIDPGIAAELVSGAAARDDRRERLAAIRARIRRDYEEGRTVDVEGWILAKTEVALCVAAVVQPHR